MSSFSENGGCPRGHESDNIMLILDLFAYHLPLSLSYNRECNRNSQECVSGDWNASQCLDGPLYMKTR